MQTRLPKQQSRQRHTSRAQRSECSACSSATSRDAAPIKPATRRQPRQCSAVLQQHNAIAAKPKMHAWTALAVLTTTTSSMAPRRTAKPPPVLPPYARGFNFAPPLSLEKWDTMQSKRVRVQILYTVGDEKDQTNHERTFLRTKRILQDRYPDALVEGVVLTNQDDAFKILVDAKGVYSKPREREGVYLSTKVLDREIARARKARRPTTTVYGGADDLENFSNGRAAADVPKYD